MRPIREFRTASVEQYEKFCKDFPERELSYKTFKEIIYKFNNKIADHILETGNKFKLPFGIGPITITKYKPTPNSYKKFPDGTPYLNKKVNWKESAKEGKIIYHLNRVTDGYQYFWAWFHGKSYIKFSHIWKLEMARVHSRKLSSYLQDPNDNHKDNYLQWINKK